MTTPITQQGPQATPATRTWCCGTLITGPHVPGCPSAVEAPVDYTGPVEVAPEPPPSPSPVQAAASRRSYGFAKSDEQDLELPSGGFIRYRQLNKGQLLELNLVEVLDGFTPELLADVQSGDQTLAEEAFLKAVLDPSKNAKIFGPTDRVVAAVVITPRVVLEGPTTDEQINVRDIDLEDKLVIFGAAVGEQLSALKSVRAQ